MILSNPGIEVDLFAGDVPCLTAAARFHQSEVLNELLGHCRDLDVNVPDSHGNTVLHDVCKTVQNQTFLGILLRDAKGLDCNIKNSMGKAPLHYAAENLTGRSVALMAEDKRFDLNIQDNEGRTPLMLSMKDPRWSNFTSFLVSDPARLNLNVTDHTGKTALHWAATGIGSRRPVQLKTFVTTAKARFDVDFFVTDDTGRTARDYAVEAGNDCLADLLPKAVLAKSAVS